MKPYIVLDKQIGETPLSCAESWRAKNPDYATTPLAYAGRLDPMASGKLLILIGEECKNQTSYHNLDKEYEFSVLFGISSDSADVLGRLQTVDTYPSPILLNDISRYQKITKDLIGTLTVPYPLFSSKTVNGKPLHTWTLENRLDEIEIPTKTSSIYDLKLTRIETLSKKELVSQALEKVNSIPPVTDLRKAIGNDFRREDVRNDWNTLLYQADVPEEFIISHFVCTASSGTYMRTLSELIAKECGTTGLAWHIHRTKIGTFDASAETWTVDY